jgi:hypothetical protein
MSQYPFPYNLPPYPPNFGYASPQGNLLSAGRRAGTLMLALGVLILLLGAVNTFTSLSFSADQLLARQKAVMPSGNEFPLSAAAYKSMALVVGVATIITGSVFIILALGVRRGSRAATVTGIVITSVLILMMGLMTLMFLLAGLGAPALFAISCLPGSALALLIWQLVWLAAAVRNTNRVSSAQQQYQMQYWQSQQNLQAFIGYGYGAAPPPVPPPTPPNAEQPH